MKEIRYALIGTSAEKVEPYLPFNYKIAGEGTEGGHPATLIWGRDNAGWTLDDYVLPRLGSGWIFGSEFTEDEAKAFLPAPKPGAEDKAWKAAYFIADVGASNPRGVQHTLDEMAKAGVPAFHPAIRAIAGHLAFLNGEALGPEFGELAAVKENARRLGLTDAEGNYIPEGAR